MMEESFELEREMRKKLADDAEYFSVAFADMAARLNGLDAVMHDADDQRRRKAVKDVHSMLYAMKSDCESLFECMRVYKDLFDDAFLSCMYCKD